LLVKEKVLAAHRVGVRTVFLRRHNGRDVEDVPAEVRAALRFCSSRTRRRCWGRCWRRRRRRSG